VNRADLRELAHTLLREELGASAVGRLCPRCGSAEHGRPYAAGVAARVSVSYATDLVAVAWADGPVGIDVEDAGPPVDGRSRAEFSASEALFKAAADVPVGPLRLPEGYVGAVAGERVSWRLAGPAAPAAPAR
jgi:phosphopantetheinyl transferase